MLSGPPEEVGQLALTGTDERGGVYATAVPQLKKQTNKQTFFKSPDVETR